MTEIVGGIVGLIVGSVLVLTLEYLGVGRAIREGWRR